MPPQTPPVDAATKRIRDALAGVIRELRTGLGLSQERLAADAGYDRTYVGQIERSEKSITIITLFDLAHVLKVSPTDIIERTQRRVDAKPSIKPERSSVKR